jgi:hypothetical protein
MKKLILALLVTFISFGVFAYNFNSSNCNSKNVEIQWLKKIDITITAGGYTIHIVGNSSYSVWYGTLTISGTISIVGNGLNVTLPFNYNGPLASRMISNNLQYDDTRLEEEDKPVVDFLVHSIIFEKGARLNFMNK